MSFFQFADLEQTIRVDAPNGEDWLELRAEFSKGEIDRIFGMAPMPRKDEHGHDVPDVGSNLRFVRAFFPIAVRRWSAADAAGNPILPTESVYDSLRGEVGQWVSKVLSDHLQSTIGKQVEQLEGKPSS